ncbi:MAG TPA: pyruvate kinase, partial [Planctomycetota bacterium]|nr:pyruvate kinase [Planctomycetota bacterium]
MLAWRKRPPRGDPSSQPRDHFRTSGWDLIFIARLINELTAIQSDQLAAEERMAEVLARIPEAHQPSARNLLHYLAMRSRDIRSLQEALASMGLSSLGRAESHVMHNVLLLLKHLHHLVRHSWHIPLACQTAITRHEGQRCLEGRVARLLGQKPKSRSTRIMVTMPEEAARDYPLVRDLVSGGMDSLRINCAHDGPDVWEAIVANLRRAEKETGQQCSILMDLGGPKIRTGRLAPGPNVVKWHPGRDEFGRPTSPARIWMTPLDRPEPPPEEADATLPVDRSWLNATAVGDSIQFRDTRGARRSLEVVGATGSSRWALSSDTSYVESGTPLVRVDRSGRKGEPEPLGELPPLERGL